MKSIGRELDVESLNMNPDVVVLLLFLICYFSLYFTTCVGLSTFYFLSVLEKLAKPIHVLLILIHFSAHKAVQIMNILISVLVRLNNSVISLDQLFE